MNCRCFRAAMLALAGVMFFASRGETQQNFTLTVPFRPGASVPQTGRVKIAFDTAASGTITVDATPITCAAPCNTLGNFGPGNADLAQVKWLSTTKVEITLTFNSDFTGNFCTSTRVADRNLALSLAGGIGATGYRMASYSVPELTNTVPNPGFQPPQPRCDNAYRRVSTARGFLSVLGGVTNRGRLPLDIALVLDKSGSMDWDIPSNPGEKRWTRLSDSVGQFVNLWLQAGGTGPGGATVEGADDDRLGLVFFNQDAENATLDMGGPFPSFRKRSQGWTAPMPDNNVITQQVKTRAPGGSTSIGDGISSANTLLDALTDKNDPSIVVFTDGEQNTDHCVLADPMEVDAVPCTTLRKPPLRIQTNTLQSFAKPILTIGLGGPGAFAELLDQISHETGGLSRISTGAAALDTNFADNLIEALKGNTMSLMTRRVETLPTAGGTPITPLVDQSVQRMVFVLGWTGVRSARLFALEIKRPDGTVVQQPPSIVASDAYIVASVDIPSTGPVGQWQARMVRAIGTEAAAGSVQYHLSAYAVERRLDYRYGVQTGPIGTGAPIVVRADIGYDGKPLDNLPAGSLRVTIARPGENLGTILSQSQANGTPLPGDSGGQSAVGAKVDALGKSDNLFDRIEPKPLPNVVNMQARGGGVYEAVFNETIVAGQYRFQLDMDWTDARTGQVRRSEIVERQVPVFPTPEATVVQVALSGGTAQVQVTPKDRFGNFVGPGFDASFSVQVAAPATVGAIANPGVNGVYVIPISGVPAGANPRVTISYRGQQLRDAPLNDLGGGGFKFPLWLLILLLVLILVIVIVIIFRKLAHP